MRSGRSLDGENYGLLTAGGWESHAWVEADGFVIDVTADQFGHAPIVVLHSPDPAYRPARDEPHRLAVTPAGHAAVEEIWPSWCADAERSGR